MNLWTRFSLAVRRRETPLFDWLYRVASAVRGLSMPVIPGLHAFLYREWQWRTSAWHNFWRFIYYEPMFKSACRHVGKGFKMWYAGDGSCRIYGDLHIYIGENVTFFDNVSLVGLRLFDSPRLDIGDNAYIGPLSRLLVAKQVTIGNYSMLGSRTLLMDNPGHSPQAEKRLVPGGGLPDVESVRPVSVGDYCFIGTGCVIYPGANVGDGVVAAAGTHIIGVIPPFTTIRENPCRVSRFLPIAPSFRDMVGDARWQAWQDARREYAREHPDVRGRENL